MKRRATTPTVILVAGLLGFGGFLGMFKVSMGDKPIFRLYAEIEKAYETELPGIKGFHCRFSADHRSILVTPPKEFPRDPLSRRRLAAIAFGRYVAMISELQKETRVETLVVTSPRGVTPVLPDEEVSAALRDAFLPADTADMRREIALAATAAASARCDVKLVAPLRTGLAVVLETDSEDEDSAAKAAASLSSVMGLRMRITYVRVERRGTKVFESGDIVPVSSSSRP